MMLYTFPRRTGSFQDVSEGYEEQVHAVYSYLNVDITGKTLVALIALTPRNSSIEKKNNSHPEELNC